MRSALTRRLQRLEQQARTQERPSLQTLLDAAVRLQTHALAVVRARLHGEEPPVYDAAQAQADRKLVARWCPPVQSRESALAQIHRTLETIAARHAAARGVLPAGVSPHASHGDNENDNDK